MWSVILKCWYLFYSVKIYFSRGKYTFKHVKWHFIFNISRAALEEVEGDVAELELKLDKVNFTFLTF